MAPAAVECPVCARKVTQTAACDGCGFVTCKRCVEANIEANPLAPPKCMNCPRVWDFDQLARATSATFMSGKFRRIREDFLLARERQVIPLCVRSLALSRELLRLDGEIYTNDRRLSQLQAEVYKLPGWDRLREKNSRRAVAIGECSACNGLLMRGRVTRDSRIAVHCASCNRTGKGSDRISATIRCVDCDRDSPAAWLNGRTPFAMARCCGELRITRLHRKRPDGRWVPATAEETTAAATAVASRWSHLDILAQYKFSTEDYWVDWNVRLRRHHSFREVQIAAIRAELARALLPEDAADISDDDRSSPGKELMRELCDPTGPAADIAALAPGTLVPSSFDTLVVAWFSCEFRTELASRLRPCACFLCLESIRGAILAGLTRVPLEHMNNELTREEYEQRSLALSGLADVFRETWLFTAYYTRLFSRVVVQLTEGRYSREQCIATLSAAHRATAGLIEAARKFYIN